MVDFIRYRYIAILFSFTCIILGFVVTFGIHGGYAHSLDFNGGLRTTIQFPESTTRDNLNSYFKNRGIEVVLIELDREKNIWQIETGLNVLDSFKNLKKENEEKGESAISEFISTIVSDYQLDPEDVMSADQVGAIVGGELTETGIYLIFWTVVVMTAYLTFRFRYFKYSVGASVALLHDLLFTLAFIGAFQIKPSIPLIAAILTLLGYSINDTIVIFDRIRENTHNEPNLPLGKIINESINETLNRTIITSFSTLIAVIAIIAGGAVELYDFAYVLAIGIIIGTFSSIFIAAPVMDIYDTLVKKRKVG